MYGYIMLCPKFRTMSAPTVTTADQQLINKFARLHQNFSQIKEEIKELSNDLLNINEAADELMLLEEEDSDSIPFRIGQTFVHFDSETMTSKLDQLKEETEQKIKDLTAQNASSQQEMGELKRTLYAKFGDRINLESDKD
ncbi:prefoldin subunit [Ancylostoma ceylanicum]|uniref:Prefoldin subunit 4 n=2 Tax=Ancylostoma ceylanicum TaxID=53326 RepID=A0A0D6LFY1_9BILA|nr:prefoldin subunit [Ancylostoma ceylanicum]